MNFITFASEAWAAYKLSNASPQLFIAWVADRFWDINKQQRPYPDCKLMAEGFYYGVKSTYAGEMEFKKMWDLYCANLSPAPV